MITTILKVILTAVASLWVFGMFSIVFPMLVGILSKHFKKQPKTDNDDGNLYIVIFFLVGGFLLSLLFHSFEFFIPTIALLAPMFYFGMGMLNDKNSGIKGWLPIIGYVTGWFIYYLI